MSDQFDRKLTDKIKEVFENYDDGSANESWDEFRKHFPDKRPHYLWWLSSAAAILLISGVWLFTDTQNDDNQTAVINHPKAETKKTPVQNLEKVLNANKRDTSTNGHSKQNVYVSSADNNAPVPVRHKTNQKRPLVNQSNALLVQSTSNLQNELTLVALVPNHGDTGRSDIQKNTTTTNLSDLSYISENTKVTDREINSHDVKAEVQLTAIDNKENQQTEFNKNHLQTENSVIKSALQSVNTEEQLTSIEQPVRKKDKHTKDKQLSNKKFSFALLAGSYINYAQGSKNSVNNKVGVSSEIKLSKKLKISTGVSLGQNSLTYKELIPETAAKNFGITRNGAVYDMLHGNNSSAAVSSINYSINSYDAKFTGFDIPINIKYAFIERKNTIYLSTGLSSNIFINESYTYTFDYKLTGNNPIKFDDQKRSSNFQSIDLAKVLNFSIGIDHPLNKRANLSFEPFVKYPLSGLGVNNLKFGAAGMNLKLNLNKAAAQN